MFDQNRLSSSYLPASGHARLARPGRAHWSPKPVSAANVCWLIAVIDVVVLAATAAAAYVIWLLNDPYSPWTEYTLVTCFGILLALNAFSIGRVYDPALLHKRRTMVGRTMIGWAAVAVALMTLSFLTKTGDDFSRLWAFMWFTTGLAGLLLTRWIVLAQVSRWVAEGRLQRKVAIFGVGELARKLSQHFSDATVEGVEVIGLFAEDSGPHQPWKTRVGYGGGLKRLIQMIRMGAVDTVIVADEGARPAELETVFAALAETPADVRYCPGEMALKLAWQGTSQYCGISVVNVVNRPLADWRHIAKAVEDRVVASLILIMISPLLLGIAAAIKLTSPGPVLFRQPRFGYNNQLVEVWKFRTMHHNLTDAKAEQLTQQNDPRVTRLGTFLRRTSLDELPQFFNVLKGDMSIVGPRPHAVSAKAGGLLYQQAVPHYSARHRVKPGITGWAQINGWRGTTDTVHQIEKRVEHDLYYIENWSVWLDLKIIFLTVFRGFSGQNAY